MTWIAIGSVGAGAGISKTRRRVRTAERRKMTERFELSPACVVQLGELFSEGAVMGESLGVDEVQQAMDRAARRHRACVAMAPTFGTFLTEELVDMVSKLASEKKELERELANARADNARLLGATS